MPSREPGVGLVRRGRRLLLAGALVAVAAACTGTPGAGPGGTPVPTVSPTPDPNALVWALPAAVTTLDAARLAVDPPGTQVAAQIYDRLVGFRPGTAELSPGLAEDWDVDVTGRAYSFTLRQGLTFHDGTALDAPAVAWNIERWLDPANPAHRDDFRTWLALFGGFKGQKDASGQPADLVQKVQVLDARTVRVSLREPFAPFLNNLAMVPFGFASPTAVRAQGDAYGSDGVHLPVGSGPYRVASWDKDGTIRLVPFSGYWGATAGAPPLQFVVVPDAGKRVELIRAGAVHAAELDATTPITGALSGPDIVVTARPPRENSWLMLNHAQPPLDDVRVRRAITLAIDRDKLAKEHFGPFALPANQLLPPGFVGYHESLPPPVFDAAAARELLAEAGMQDGFKLIIWAPNSPREYMPDPVGTAEAVAAMLRDVGIDASVRTKSLRQFLSDRDNGRYNAWIIGWEAQSADPDNFWYWHFGAGRAASEGQYHNDQLAADLLQAQRMFGSGQRAERYQAAAEQIIADAARVFLVHARSIVALSPRVRDYRPNTMGFDDLSTVRLAPAPSGATAVPIPTGAPGTPIAGTGLDTTPGTPPATEAISATTQATDGAASVATGSEPPATDTTSPASDTPAPATGTATPKPATGRITAPNIKGGATP
jgi:peptide/nickel transport system substrate-binding protein